MKYKSRKKFPYFTDNLDLLVEAINNGETVAVEGGPCLFGAHEVRVFVHTDDGTTHEFDYANGKIRLSDGSFSDDNTLAQFVLHNGAHVDPVARHVLQKISRRDIGDRVGGNTTKGFGGLR